MSGESNTELSIVLIAQERLTLAGLQSLLSEKGFPVEQTGLDPDDIDLSSSDIFEDTIFVLVDSQNSDGSIFSNMAKLISLNKDVKIVVISGHHNGDYLERCFQSGAVGYILTSSSEEVLIDCMRLVQHGQNVFPSEFVKWMAQGDGEEAGDSERSGRPVSLNNLSQRDRRILRMLVSGLPNKEIGLNLQIPDTSVKVLVKALSGKIGASNRVQAAVWAVKNGLAPYSETPDGTGETGNEFIAA
jgi:two-component system nitrate/nitrite response regulator NarL